MKTEEIEIEKLHQSQTNQRVNVGDKSIDELMASIQSVGLLNPLIVRKNADGFEIIAGHRRFAALKRLNAKVAAVHVVDAIDGEELKIQIAENLQRVDLNPIEEARSFEILAKQFNLDAKAIAMEADKSEAYVTRALALLTLKPATQAMIAGGALSAAHGHQIARVDGKQRETIEKYATTTGDWNKRFPTLDELMDEIEKKIERNLSKAVFPKDVPYYANTETLACTACKFNTGNQNVLFDGAQKGSCTNGECFTKRTKFAFNQMRDNVLLEIPELKFIGFSSAPGYMGQKEVKGYPIMKLTLRSKEVKDNPKKYGFTIQRPSRFDESSGSRVVIVALNKKEKSQVESGPDYQRERYINERVGIVLKHWANEKTPEIEKKHVIQMMNVDAKEAKTIEKKSMQECLRIMWLDWLGDWQLEKRLIDSGFDAEKIKSLKKTAAKEAAKMYDEDKKASVKKS